MTGVGTLSPWRPARLIDKSPETSRGGNLLFAVDGWRGHRAGQHVDVRLTAPARVSGAAELLGRFGPPAGAHHADRRAARGW